MKKTEFEKKDGTKGHKYTLEEGDMFISRFESPRKTQMGKYDNYSLGITTVPEGDDIFVQLTQGQAKKLESLGNIQGKKLQCYKYESHDKECVGVKLA